MLFPMNFRGTFPIRKTKYEVADTKLWKLPQHEFMVRDYFRKFDIPFDLFPKNFYDLTLLKKYETHVENHYPENHYPENHYPENHYPENLFLLRGDKYIKFSDMSDDLIDFVRFFRIEVDEESGIEFFVLRRKIDKKSYHMNSVIRLK
jgi:hypothetical protein